MATEEQIELIKYWAAEGLTYQRVHARTKEWFGFSTLAKVIKENSIVFPTKKKPTVKTHWAYNKWTLMMRRCTDPNSNRYHRYGGRGITVEPFLQDSRNYCALMDVFFSEMRGKGRGKGNLSLDRIDNDGPYAVWNLRVADQITQYENSTSLGGFGRASLVKSLTHCEKGGHEFTPENTLVKKNGRRGCRACENAAQMRRYYAKRANND